MERILEQTNFEKEIVSVDVSKYIAKVDKNFVKYLCRLIPPNSKVLDVGCGIGAVLGYLEEKRKDLILKGVDNSATVIYAVKKLSNKRINIIKGDAENLQFSAESFDVVVSSSFLHHVFNPLSVLREMLRITKVGGKVVVRDLIRPKSNKILEKIVYCRKEPQVIKNILRDSLHSSFKINEIEKYLAELNIVDYKIIKRGIRFMLIIDKKY